MDDDKKSTTKNVANACTWGPLWFVGWLFTIGFVHLSFWKAILALAVWPYYLGIALSA
ncbi:hypothetical protein JXA70_19130 [candidate division KSB1 bacterium]|nr:hypothetical protein [candidate division KSB1 bacterium]